MIRRTLTIAAVCAMASAGLAGTAFADATCVTHDDGSFAGTVVCVDTESALGGSYVVNYSISDGNCVEFVCTPAISDSISVPMVNDNVVYAYGTLCYRLTPKNPQTCRSFTTYNVLAAIGSGTL